jgi:hypothetical protein
MTYESISILRISYRAIDIHSRREFHFSEKIILDFWGVGSFLKEIHQLLEINPVKFLFF